MELINNMMTLSQQSDAERPSLFPFPFSMHLIFVCVSVLFFAYRFYVQKRPFQLLMAIAVFVSMGVWISDNRTLYYAIGVIELVLIIASIVLSIIIKRPDADKKSDDRNGDNTDDEDEVTAINSEKTADEILNN